MTNGSFEQSQQGWAVKPQLGIKEQGAMSIMCKCQVDASCGPVESLYSSMASGKVSSLSVGAWESQLVGRAGHPQVQQPSAGSVPQLNPS